MQECSWDLVSIYKQKRSKSFWYLPWHMFVLAFILANTSLLVHSPVARISDVSEANDFAFSLCDRRVASYINKS